MTARRVGPDFHLVELTEDGLALANGGPLRISNGHISVLFTPGLSEQTGGREPVKVARYEWDMLLRDHAYVDGRKLFSIVVPEAVTAEAVAAPVPETIAAPESVEPVESKEKD